MRNGVFAEQAVEPKIDMRLLRRDFVLGGQNIGRARRRDGVRHVEHGGHAAEGRGCRTAGEIFFVGIAGIAKVDVVVDHPRQDMQPGRVQRLTR